MANSALIIPFLVGITILVLFISFIMQYVVPALKIQAQLKKINGALKNLTSQAYDQHIAPNEVVNCMQTQSSCAQIWKEYATTLHLQQTKENLPRYRTTTPSAVFFTEVRLIDNLLHVEFFKHLPGILTGIGIIGTFWGLVMGLSGFHPTENPTEVRMSLTALIGGVREAFIASGLAITAAMIITFLEKLLIARGYKQIHVLTESIDALFHAGVVEEYLASLVAEQKETILVLQQGDQNRQTEHNQLQEAFAQLTAQLTQQQAATIQWLEEVQIKKGFGSIYTALKNLQKVQEDNHTIAQLAQHAQYEGLIRSFADFSNQTVENTQRIVENQQTEHQSLRENLAEQNNTLSVQLKTLIQKIDTHFGAALKEQKSHEEAIQVILTDQTQKILSTFTHYGKNLDTHLSHLKLALNQHWDKNADLIVKFESSLDSFVTKVNDVNQQIVITVNQIHARMEESLGLIEENANQFERISQQLDMGFEKGVKFYQESGKILSTLRQNTEFLTEITGRSEQIVTHYNQVNQDLTAIVNNVGGMTGTFDHHFGRIAEIEDKLSEMANYVITTMDESFSGLTVSMKENFDAFTENMQISRTKLDDKLEKTALSLTTSVQELAQATMHIQQVNYNLEQFNYISEGLKASQRHIAEIVMHSESVLKHVRKNTTDFDRIVTENQVMLALQEKMQTQMQTFVVEMAGLVSTANHQFEIVTRGYAQIEQITEHIQPILSENFDLFKEKMQTHQDEFNTHLIDRIDAFEQTIQNFAGTITNINQVYSNTHLLKQLSEDIQHLLSKILVEERQFEQMTHTVQARQQTLSETTNVIQVKIDEFLSQFKQIAYGMRIILPKVNQLVTDLEQVMPTQLSVANEKSDPNENRAKTVSDTEAEPASHSHHEVFSQEEK